jgi:hypothetical protein
MAHHVFSDASIQNNKVYIGVYCNTLNISKTLEFDVYQDNIHKAEMLGILVAKELTKAFNCWYFTDNLTAYQRLSKTHSNVCWLPREYNKKADKLANKETIKGCIAQYLRTNYTDSQLEKLIHKILKVSDKYSVTKLFDKNTLSKQLLFTLLPQKLSKEQKKYIINKKIKTLSNQSWVKLFKGITPCNSQQK